MNIDDFKKQYLPYHQKLYRVAYNLLKNEEDAKDIVQDAYYKLWKNRNRLDQVNNGEAFSVITVKNLCLDFIKSPKTSRNNKDNIDEAYKLGDNTSFIYNLDSKNKLVEAKVIIEQLPENQKQVIMLRVVNDYSLDEIEEITGFSAVNVRVLLSRARKTIREDLVKIFKLD